MPPLLFIPGPVNTTDTVKQQALQDYGSRSEQFSGTIKAIRSKLLDIAGVSEETHTATLIAGCGTYGIESVISSIIPENGDLHVLVAINGSYGTRIQTILDDYSGSTTTCHYLEYDWNEAVKVSDVLEVLNDTPEIEIVIIVHHETTTGIMNPMEELGEVIKQQYPHIIYIVDAMSSFGGIPIDFSRAQPTYLISSANKCMQGIPGFTYVISERTILQEQAIHAPTLSLDLKKQWEFMENNNQFRFTPPTQAVMAFHQALLELEAEGGVVARNSRFKANQECLATGMQELGFKLYLDPQIQGPVITCFQFPTDDFNFPIFASQLEQRGFVIYTGKMKPGTFRVGHIGTITPTEIKAFLNAVKEIMASS